MHNEYSRFCINKKMSTIEQKKARWKSNFYYFLNTLQYPCSKQMKAKELQRKRKRKETKDLDGWIIFELLTNAI
jgi:hypothetical protein